MSEEKRPDNVSAPPPAYDEPAPTVYPQQQAGVGYPPQQPGVGPGPYGQAYGPPPAPAGPAVYGTTTVISNVPVRFGPAPQQAHCPRCNQIVLTNIEYENGMLVWAAAGIVILFGGIFGCCLIPFCINDLKNVRHTCPTDNQVLGVYDRSRSF